MGLYGIIEVELSQQPEGLGLRNPRGLRGRELDMTLRRSVLARKLFGDSSTASRRSFLIWVYIIFGTILYNSK